MVGKSVHRNGVLDNKNTLCASLIVLLSPPDSRYVETLFIRYVGPLI